VANEGGLFRERVEQCILLDVRGSVHHSAIHKEKSNKL